MMKISSKIQFDESKFFSEQTPEFQAWYNENVNGLINDQLAPDILDEFKRPKSYTIKVESFTITVYPIYIYPEQSNWACSNLQLIIKSV